MAQFLKTDQSKYVPLHGNDIDEQIVLESIFLDGDQLTEERARNVQWVFQDGDNVYDRLEGLDPTHPDWHAKVNLYQVLNCNTNIHILILVAKAQLQIVFNTS